MFWVQLNVVCIMESMYTVNTYEKGKPYLSSCWCLIYSVKLYFSFLQLLWHCKMNSWKGFLIKKQRKDVSVTLCNLPSPLIFPPPPVFCNSILLLYSHGRSFSRFKSAFHLPFFSLCSPRRAVNSAAGEFAFTALYLKFTSVFTVRATSLSVRCVFCSHCARVMKMQMNKHIFIQDCILGLLLVVQTLQVHWRQFGLRLYFALFIIDKLAASNCVE